MCCSMVKLPFGPTYPPTLPNNLADKVNTGVMKVLITKVLGEETCK